MPYRFAGAGNAITCLACVALAACAPARVEIVKPPVSLTTCAEEPLAPNLPGRDQQVERDRLMLEYVLGLRSAWGSCRAAVEGLRAWSEGL